MRSTAGAGQLMGGMIRRAVTADLIHSPTQRLSKENQGTEQERNTQRERKKERKREREKEKKRKREREREVKINPVCCSLLHGGRNADICSTDRFSAFLSLSVPFLSCFSFPGVLFLRHLSREQLLILLTTGRRHRKSCSIESR